jgi:hypothetical protein
MLTATYPISGGHSVGIVHSWTQTTEFFISVERIYKLVVVVTRMKYQDYYELLIRKGRGKAKRLSP